VHFQRWAKRLHGKKEIAASNRRDRITAGEFFIFVLLFTGDWMPLETWMLSS
jgi:hypothetical protein